MPIVSPDQVVTAPGMPVLVRPLDNDQGESLILVGLGSPAHGSLALNADQTLIYTPAAGFAGEDGFTYTVQDAAGGTAEGMVAILVNAAPMAAADHASTASATPVAVPVLANDVDPEGQPLAVVAVATPGHGTVELQADGSLRYAPQHGFFGSDSFAYTVADPHGAQATAAVTVSVADANRPPVARDDAVTVPVQASTVIEVAANDDDPDGDPLALTGFSLPQHGLLQTNGAASVVYTPASGFSGEDGFTYTVGDGRGGSAAAEVRIRVERPNTAPVAADASLSTASGTAVAVAPLALASDADGDPLTLAGLTLPTHGQLQIGADYGLTYTPDAGFSGEDGFTYTVSDGRGGSDQGSIAVTVLPPPSPPTFANGYARRRRLVVPRRTATAEAAADFVMRVDETGTWLRVRSLGGGVESPAGFDLRFELEDGTRLPHEVELYDDGAGRLLAWVRLPGWVLSQEVRLFLYYGKAGLAASEANPAGVWAGYLAVWDARTGVDRSGNGRHLTPSGIAAGELIGPAGSFSGTATASIASTAGLAGHAALCLQAWAKADATALGSNRGILAQGPRNGADQDHGLVLRQAATGFRGGAGDIFVWSLATSAGVARLESAADAQSARAQGLHAIWRSGELPQLYVDGVATAASWAGAVVGSTATSGQALSGTTALPAGSLVLGAGSVAGEPGAWKGLLDEVRLRAAAPSTARIAAEHASQADPQGFYGMGAEDDAGTAPASTVAVPARASTSAGQRVDIDVLALAYVPAGAASPLLQSVTQPANGLATIVSGQVRYTPNAGFSGSDGFTYTLAADGKVSTGRILVEVAAVTQELPTPLRVVNVTDRASLQAALAAALPGDRIQLANGTYAGAALTFARSIATTAARPVVIAAASKLGAKITMALETQVPHTVFWGLHMDGVPLRVKSSHSRVLRCKHSGCESSAIVLYGPTTGIEIGYCDISVKPYTFGTAPAAGKKDRRGIDVSMSGDADAPKEVHVHHCWIHDFGMKPLSDYDSGQNHPLRTAETSSQANTSSRWLIEYNLLERCDCSVPTADGKGIKSRVGTLEPKSSDNVIRYNTCVDSPGFIQMRQGFNNQIIGNWIENSGGLVLYGGGPASASLRADPNQTDNHKVIGNYLKGTIAGIRVLAGQEEEWTLAADTQPRAKDVLLVGNDSHLYEVGRKYTDTHIYPADGTRLEACRKSGGGAFGTGTGITAGNLASMVAMSGTGFLQTNTSATGANTTAWVVPTPVKLGNAQVGPDAAWAG